MCDFCEGKTKYTSVNYELKIGDGFLKNRRYLLVKFVGCPPNAKCCSNQNVVHTTVEFELDYCPDCGKKLKEE